MSNGYLQPPKHSKTGSAAGTSCCRVLLLASAIPRAGSQSGNIGTALCRIAADWGFSKSAGEMGLDLQRKLVQGREGEC